MKSVRKKKKKVKEREWLENQARKLESGMQDLNSKIELIQALIPLGLMHVNQELQEEVERLAGKKHSRGENSRWGSQAGSVYLLDQKIPVRVPRVRNKVRDTEVALDFYKGLQQTRKEDDVLLKRVISGLSCHRYEECAQTVPGVFGLSSSTVSRRYIRASARKLKELTNRNLEDTDIIGIFMDGKTFSEDEMIIALGITITGVKIILGFIQAGSENECVCRDFLKDLKERGLNYEEGILFVIDGSKGLCNAIKKEFKEYGFVQRCQWHKRKNILSYLPKSKQEEMKKKLQDAYEEPSYEKAKAELKGIRKELKQLNESAVKSLDDGFEETLTLHKLGVFKKLGISFKTTNCIESIMSQIEQRTGRVSYWKNSNQKHRWLAAALLDIEPRLRKVKGWRHLPSLRMAMKNKLNKSMESEVKLEAA